MGASRIEKNPCVYLNAGVLYVQGYALRVYGENKVLDWSCIIKLKIAVRMRYADRIAVATST